MNAGRSGDDLGCSPDMESECLTLRDRYFQPPVFINLFYTAFCNYYSAKATNTNKTFT